MNSEQIINFLYSLSNRGIKLWADNEKIQLITPENIALSQDESDFITKNKEAILEKLKKNLRVSEEELLILGSDEKIAPVSFAQERLYFINQFEGGTIAYNIPLIFRPKEGQEFNVLTFQKSLTEVINRHEILRTFVRESKDGKLFQEVSEDISNHFTLDLYQAATKKELHQLIEKQINTVFNLNSDYPIRAMSIQLEGKFYISIVIHHIAFDGWSVDLFLRELNELYNHYQSKKDLNLPTNFLQYKDFALWQKSYENGGVFQKQLNYWKNRLEDWESLNLILDAPRPTHFEYRGKDIPFLISAEESEALRILASQLEVSLYTILLSAFYLMLRVYSYQDDIIVGTTVSNRHYYQLEKTIGFFINSLPLRMKISSDHLVKDFIKQVGVMVIESQLNQDLPFEKLIEELKVTKDTSRHPVFQVMFEVQNFGADKKGVFLERYDPEEEIYRIAKFDLSVLIDDSEKELKGSFNFATSLFKEDSIQRFLKTYLTILRRFVGLANDRRRQEEEYLFDLSYLDEDEFNKIVNDWNETGKEILRNETPFTLFEKQVFRSPNDFAAICEEEKITYLELYKKVNQFAAFLNRNYEAKEEDLIILILDRSINFLAIILAVFKIGAAFVPIDPAIPQDRIQSIIEECGKRLVITDQNNRELTDKFREFFVDSCVVENIDNVPNENVDFLVNNRAIAYVIYTSGSTGKPKGAIIEYEGMLNHLLSKIEDLNITSQDIIGQIASQSFDVSIWQFLCALFVGGITVIFKGYSAWDPEPLLRIILNEKVTILETVPSHMNSILEEMEREGKSGRKSLKSLRWLILNGEALLPTMCDKWFFHYPNIPIVNAYGATEASDDTCHYKILDPNYSFKKIMPIGGTIRNLTLYILDRSLNPIPIGAVGEIYFGGIGVGRGYFNRPELTAERFIPNPFNKGIKMRYYDPTHHLRLYKTGDLGRYLADGSIEFCGRVDFQVKIRGHRVELEEIEKKISEYKEIKHVVVLIKNNKTLSSDDGKLLVAYYISDQEVNEEKLYKELCKKLPEYMVPSAFIRLEKFPLTVSGKIDRKALPEPEIKEKKTYIAPRDNFELQLATIWGKVLGIPTRLVGVQDNFFHLGGDSIISIQLVSRIRQELGLLVRIKDIFENPTIECLVKNVLKDKKEKVVQTQSEQGELGGRVPLLPIQKWFFNQQFSKPGHWNQSFLVKVPELSEIKLLESLSKLVKHHDALRLRYRENSRDLYHNHPETSGITQFYASYDQSFSVKTQYKSLDIRLLKDKNLSTVLTKWQDDFDLQDGPLFRFGYLFGYPDQTAKLFFAFHHLIIDAVSWRIIIDDLRSLYEDYGLGPKGMSYRQWAEKLLDYPLKNNKEEIAYWKVIKSDFESGPYQIESYLETSNKAKVAEVSLSSSQTEVLIRGCNKVYNVEIQEVLLSAMTYLMFELTKQKSSYVLIEGHGREAIDETIDLSRTVGWFTSLFPFKLTLYHDIPSTLINVKESLRRIPNKGLGYGIHDHEAFPKVAFNYLGQFVFENNSEGEQTFWNILWEDAGQSISNLNLEHNLLTMNIMIIDGQLKCIVVSRIQDYEVNEIGKLYLEKLRAIIEYASTQKRSYLTPSDVGFIIHRDYLDKIQKEKEIENVFLANSLQQGLLYHYLNGGDLQDGYRVQLIFQYHEKIDKDLLLKAWEIAQEQFAVLRLRFAWDSEIVQIIDKKGMINWRFIDLSYSSSRSEQEGQILEIQKRDRQEKFKLEESPLFRVYLIKQNEDLYTTLFSNHHAILDGWSNGILLKFVHDTYLDLKMGNIFPIRPDQTYQKAQQYLQNHQKESSIFWKNYLASVEEPTRITSSSFSKGKMAFTDQEKHLVVDQSVYEKIKEISKNEGVTLNAILQFALHKTLYIFTQRQRTIVGTTVSGRLFPVDHIEDSVGLFINTLPLAFNHAEKEKIVLEAVRQIQTDITEINSNSNVNLSNLQMNGEHLFDTIFIFENYPTPVSDHRKKQMKVTFLKAIEKLDYPLVVIAYEEGSKLEIILKYDQSFMDTLFIDQWARTFHNILFQLTDKYKMSLNKLDNLPKEDLDDLLSLNPSEATFSYPLKVFSDLFEEQVSLFPNAKAIICEDRELTYFEVNEKANQLAHLLKEKIFGLNEPIIGICLKRSERIIVSMLAIFKVGAAYLPIDPTYPIERIEYILSDSDAVCVITDEKVELTNLFDVVSLDNNEKLNSFPKNNLQLSQNVNQLAYVIYTSGTAGKPKGVLIEQKAFIAKLFAIKEKYFNECSSISTYSITSYVFDIFGLEYGLSLLFGGVLTIGLKPVIDRLDCSKYDFIQMTPSLWNINLDQLYKYERLILFVGGEALSQKLLDKIQSKGINCVNLYGPTETTIWSTAMDYFREAKLKKTRIGTPLPNERVYVLDEQLKPQPKSALGELFIGGVGVARGYLNQAELTTERFIQSPFHDGKIYRTGDLVRWLPDNTLEYVDRKDFQIKLNGHRIEVGEIEHFLITIPKIIQSVVVLKKEFLIAYYETEDGLPLEEEEIEQYLAKKLPSYMIPKTYIHLLKFHLTTSGKLDRNQLPEPQITREKFLGPRNPLEKQIRHIWAIAIEIPQEDIDLRDDFFKLGGNSLSAIKIITRVNKYYFCHLKLADLFICNTLEKFVPKITKSREGFKVIMRLNDSQSETKMFMIHPGGGGCEVYLPLAKTLSSEFNCFGVDYYNLYSESKLDSIEEIAAFYLSEIDEIEGKASRNNYYLLGWSLGGRIALEIAALLEARGVESIKVILLDTILNDDYLNSLGIYEDIETREKKFTDHALKEGYNQEYIQRIKENIKVETILGTQKISKILTQTQILLFKAMNEDKTISEIMKNHEKIYGYLKKLKYSNVDQAVLKKEQIILEEIFNVDHGRVLDNLNLLVPKIISFKA